jgi:hypothetical protein
VFVDLSGVVRALPRSADEKNALDWGVDIYELADIGDLLVVGAVNRTLVIHL